MSGNGIRASGRPPQGLARRWLKVLAGTEERLKGRIRRGKTLARSGRIQSLEVAPGTVYADVEDGGDLFRPILRVRTYEEEEWARTLALLGEDLGLLAALMEGDLDYDFVATLHRGGVSLFPERAELDGDCDCGDYALPCAHGAAIHYLLAEALEGEPLLLFALRGRPREQLIAEFRRQWGDTSVAPSQTQSRHEEVPPPGEWFSAPQKLPPMTFRFHPPARSPGLVELGPPPGDGDLLKTLEPLYDAGAEAARELALTDVPEQRKRERGRPRRPRGGPAVLPFSGAAAAPEPAESPGPPPPAKPDGFVEREASAPRRVASELGEQLVDYLAEADHGASTRELAEAVGAATLRVRRELLELERIGVVARTGSTRATRWWLG